MNAPLTANQGADYFDGKPVASGGKARITTAQARALLETAMAPDAPSPLPTLAEVKLFTEHWRDQIQAIDSNARASFQIYHSHSGTRFYAYSDSVNGVGATPEEALSDLAMLAGPQGRAERIAKLKAELAALEVPA